MKILFANNLCGYYGGVEQVVEDYARALALRGHDCHLAYAQVGREAVAYAQAFNTTSLCSDFGMVNEGVPFADAVRRLEPDVVFVHKVSQLPPYFDGNQVCRTVRMVHDHDLWCPKGTGYYTHNRKTCGVRAGLACYLDGAFIARNKSGALPIKLRNISATLHEMRRNFQFDAVLVLSQYLRDRLALNGFPPARMHIHNPVVKQEIPASQPLPSEPKVLFVGSLVRGKGVDMLLRALALLRCEVRLDIVGSGSEEVRLRKLAQDLGVAAKVNFVGWVPHDRLTDFYRAARVVAVPSCWPEPFGLIGQEAMRSARPVVAFNVGGIPDWCDDGQIGLLVPEQDVQQFANAMERLLTDYAFANELGLNGYKKAQLSYSFEQSIDRLEALLSGSD